MRPFWILTLSSPFVASWAGWSYVSGDGVRKKEDTQPFVLLIQKVNLAQLSSAGGVGTPWAALLQLCQAAEREFPVLRCPSFHRKWQKFLQELDSPFHACALPESPQKMCTLCCSGLCLLEESQDHEGKLLLFTKKPHSPCCCNFFFVRSCLNYSIGLQVWAVSQFKQEAEEFLWAWNLLIFEFYYTREWQNSGACREWNNFPTACEHHLVHCSWRRRSTKDLNWWKVFHLLGKVELYFISDLHFTTCDFELCCPFYACFS